MVQNFKKDFIEIIELVHSNKPFALSRFADGEIAIMQGKQKNGADNWVSPNYLTKLGSDLLECISLIDNDVYFGISCSCCDLKGRDYLLELIKNKKENVTFSNIFVNGNYSDFVNFFKNLKKPINLISNHRTDISKFPMEIKSHLPIPDNCIEFYENLRDEFRQSIVDYYKDVNNELFIISAGPLSEIIIDILWKINPTNQYIDVGSSISEFVHGKPIREFAYEWSKYHKKDCVF
jgi:hypothetical protein